MTPVESISTVGSVQESELIDYIQEDIKAAAGLGLLSNGIEDLDALWQTKVEQEPKRFINRDLSLNVDALRNFWRLSLFVDDFPSGTVSRFNPRSVLGGTHRGNRKLLRESLAVVREQGYDYLLGKYPCPTVGNPSVFRSQGFRFTYRWLKHIYLLGLMEKVLNDRLGDDFITMDIGSSFGCLSALLKEEHPSSRHLLVDFYEQLVLAYYFLGMLFREPRIAGVKEISGLDQISADFIKEYDFVLIPCGLYSRISPETVDLVVNVASLGEMSRTWFDFYLQSSVFQTAKYFFTYNRMQSYPSYESNLTVLDYPLLDPEKRLHFAISPFRSNRYARWLRFFCRPGPFLPVFEYIGEI